MKKLYIGGLEVGGAPRVVGSVSSKSAIARLPLLKRRDFDILEVRADAIRASEWIPILNEIKKIKPAAIFTARSVEEGGKWRGTEDERRALYSEIMRHTPAIDVEIGSRFFRKTAEEARQVGTVVIGSFHNFDATPDRKRLLKVLEAGRKGGAHIVKVATFIREPSDVVTLFELVREADNGPLCLIGMGQLGMHSRISLACAGSCLTYGYIDRSAAPGQMSCRRLQERLRESCPSYNRDYLVRHGRMKSG